MGDLVVGGSGFVPAPLSKDGNAIIASLSAWLHEAQRSSEHTLRAYRTVVQMFLGWCHHAFENGDDERLWFLLDVKPMHVKAWISTLDCAKSTRAHRLAVLRSMFRALVADGIRADNPAREVRPGKGVAASVDHTEALPPKVVLDGLSMLGDSVLDRRDRAMFLMMLNQGLRRGEVVKLRLSNLDFRDDGAVLLLRGKGEKAARIPLAIPTARAVMEWLKVRPNKESGQDRLFVSVRGRPLHGRDVARRVKAVFGHRWKSHGLRARSITDTFLRSGKNMWIAQAFARHANPSTTQTYIDVERAKEASAYAPEYF